MPEGLRGTGQVRESARLVRDGDVEEARPGAEANVLALVLDQLEILEPSEVVRAANRKLGRLLRERVRGPSPVAVEHDAAGEVLVQHRPAVRGGHSSEVEALGEEDHVSGEAVAAEV